MNLLSEIHSVSDIDLLRESVDLECKLALGQDGQGKLPKDFWPTYSAMANTEGGLILLGVQEKKGRFHARNIPNPGAIRKELADLLGNRQKVSVNLLSDDRVHELDIEGSRILAIEVPRATRKQRPVFIHGNPLGGTYRRFHEADQEVPEDEVKLMLSEGQADSLDYRVLPRFGMHDLSLPTLQAYRQTHATLNPGHPWSELDNLSFLREIRAWNTDRETGEEGLTVAGLLMFGKFQSIQDEFPHYALDYQERPEAKADKRWIDRVWLDGSWSGNLYDFFRLAHLFGFVRIGEKAGTGIPKIMTGWRSQHWRKPSLTEEYEPSPRTILRLQMLDLFPPGVLDLLKVAFKEHFETLDPDSRLALAVTFTERRLTHVRLCELTDLHPSDVTKILRNLVAQGFLVTGGQGRGTVYRFKGTEKVSPEDVFEGGSSPDLPSSSPDLPASSPNLPASSPNLPASSPNLPLGFSQRDESGRLLSMHFPLPFIDQLQNLTPNLLDGLSQLAAAPQSSGRISRERMIEIILSLCDGHYVRLDCLAKLVNRSPNTLQGQYLTRLCRDQRLRMAFQDNPTDPRQAYTKV